MGYSTQREIGIVNRDMKKIAPSMIRKVMESLSEMKNPANFSIGAPCHNPSELFKVGLINAINDGKAGYTPSIGIKDLREEIVKYFAKRNIITDSDHTVVTGGTTQLINSLLYCIGSSGDDVGIIRPSFVIYPEQTKIHKKNPIYIDFDKNTLLPDIEDLRKKSKEHNLKSIVFSSPGNPTGVVYPKETLELIAEIANDRNSDGTKTWIIFDQIYDEFLYGDALNNYTRMAQIYKRTMSVGGPAKSLAIPGYRLACGAIPNDEIMEAMETHLLYHHVNAPTHNQLAFLYALQNGAMDTLQGMRNMYGKRRDIAYKELTKIFGNFGPKPEGAFYIFVPIPEQFSSDEFMKLAKKEEIVVVPGKAFGADRYFRLSYSVKSIDSIREGIQRFSRFVK